MVQHNCLCLCVMNSCVHACINRSSLKGLLYRGSRRHYASVQKYSDTLNLPTTKFPLRPDHAGSSFGSEPSELYRWQRLRHSLNDNGEESDLKELDTKEFILHDGPPFANGDLHIGHALNKVLKDIIVRRKILDGQLVKYVPGWDCHGLPIELKALQARQEQDPSVSTSDGLPAPEIRSLARGMASETIHTQSAQFRKFAICADWTSPYRTFDLSYELSQLRVFAEMVDRGLIYRAEKPVYWSPSSRTALAEAELEYSENHISHSAYVAYPLNASLQNEENIHLLIWTTTPWTLPANRAIAVNPDLDYCILSRANDSRRFVVATSLVDRLKKVMKGRVQVLGKVFPGRELLQFTYEDILKTSHLGRPILAADYVTADSGTGLVHTAPGHGMEDYLLCREQTPPIKPFSPVDDTGAYTQAVKVKTLVGLNAQVEGSKRVIELLENNKTLIAVERYRHKYPYDWRTKRPVIVRSTPQFFADLSSIREQALKSLEQVKMVPESGKARLQSYVQGRNEWCISRQRSWGVPIPALYAQDGEVLLSKESITHILSVLEQEGMDSWFKSDTSPDDWQKWVPKGLRDGKTWQRGRETLDVWFDSGCSWQTLQKNEDHGPVVADLYLEGSDQHRGWFQSSLLTSTATRGIAPYKQILTHGFVLDKKGLKMSKSIGNVIDPLLIIEGRAATEPVPVPHIENKKQRKQMQKMAQEAATEVKPLGVDALRLWVAQSDYTSDVSVSTDILGHVAESLRKFRSTIRYMLGNLEDFDPCAETQRSDYSAIDQYAEAQSTRFRAQAERNFEAYTFNKVVASLNQYTNAQLSAFYFDTLKDRLYADGSGSASRRSAQAALYHILKDYLVVLAPICPSIIQEAWQHMAPSLRQNQAHIYATTWPQKLASDIEVDDPGWESMMRLRDMANKELQIARFEKLITSSLQAELRITLPSGMHLPVPDHELSNFFIVSNVHMARSADSSSPTISVDIASMNKCPRCWVYTAQTADSPCKRCQDVLAL